MAPAGGPSPPAARFRYAARELDVARNELVRNSGGRRADRGRRVRGVRRDPENLLDLLDDPNDGTAFRTLSTLVSWSRGKQRYRENEGKSYRRCTT
jgi:hypothetical protein